MSSYLDAGMYQQYLFADPDFVKSDFSNWLQPPSPVFPTKIQALFSVER